MVYELLLFYTKIEPIALVCSMLYDIYDVVRRGISHTIFIQVCFFFFFLMNLFRYVSDNITCFVNYAHILPLNYCILKSLESKHRLTAMLRHLKISVCFLSPQMTNLAQPPAGQTFRNQWSWWGKETASMNSLSDSRELIESGGRHTSKSMLPPPS